MSNYIVVIIYLISLLLFLLQNSCTMCTSARPDGTGEAGRASDAAHDHPLRGLSSASILGMTTGAPTAAVSEEAALDPVYDEGVDVGSDEEYEDDAAHEIERLEAVTVVFPRAADASSRRSSEGLIDAPGLIGQFESKGEKEKTTEKASEDKTASPPKKLPAGKVSYAPAKDSAVQAKAKKIQGDAEDLIVLHVKGKLSALGRFETRMEGLLVQGKGVATPLDISSAMMEWTSEMDNNLLEFVNQEQTSTSSSSKQAAIGPTIVLPKTQLLYGYSNLSNIGMLEVQNRTLLIESMNHALEEILPIINLGNTDARSFGATIRRYSKYVFMSLKTPLLDKAIKQSFASGAGMPAQMTLDNFKAIESREKGEKDPATSMCTFVQAFKQLQNKDSAVFRHTFSDNRVFQITFTGESGIDAGGVFREGMSRIVEDVFSEHFNLLLLCPNGQHTVHINTDKYVPNPQHTGPLAMQMYEFLGRLMGSSLRAKLGLPFQFPSIVWKKLIGEDVNVEDLMNFDALTYKLIDAIRHCERDGITDQSAFSAKYNDQLRFIYNGSDGVERELIKGQGSKIVSYESRHEYCDLLLNARLSEFDKQVAAMSKGLLDVVPSRVLQLFSASQVEILIAGNPNFDMDLWKKQTDASSISPRTLALFWQVMESLTPQEQSGFVRFAWGRSRLPGAKEFTVKMKLTAGSSALPIAHTCFFSVEMPDYKTAEEMRHGLLTVINFGCGGILNG
jgi:hypothetical protein